MVTQAQSSDTANISAIVRIMNNLASFKSSLTNQTLSSSRKYVGQSMDRIIACWRSGETSKKEKEKEKGEGLLGSTMEEMNYLHGADSPFKEIESGTC